jgi:acyl carrier protein
MSSDDVWSVLEKVFKKVFDDDVVISEETTAKDVVGWDSLNHVRLIVAVEKAFRTRFTAAEVSDLKSVGDLKRTLEAKLRNPA